MLLVHETDIRDKQHSVILQILNIINNKQILIMKNLAKIVIGTLVLGYTLNAYAEGGTKKIEDISCKNAQGQEVSIGNDCITGSSTCVENGCPKGTGEL